MNIENIKTAWNLIPLQLWNTLYMTFASTFFAIAIGFPIGILLSITKKGHIKENKYLHQTLQFIVNIGRSLPFVILMVVAIPLTRLIVGTSLGTNAAIVPLTLAAAPFIARLIETNLQEVDRQILETAIVMGSTHGQIIRKVLIPEALPQIISSFTITLVNLIGYSTMAGLVGGGGLGQIAIQYGYQRFNTFIMSITVALLILLVKSVQSLGNQITRSIYKTRGIIPYE